MELSISACVCVQVLKAERIIYFVTYKKNHHHHHHFVNKDDAGKKKTKKKIRSQTGNQIGKKRKITKKKSQKFNLE